MGDDAVFCFCGGLNVRRRSGPPALESTIFFGDPVETAPYQNSLLSGPLTSIWGVILIIHRDVIFCQVLTRTNLYGKLY